MGVLRCAHAWICESKLYRTWFEQTPSMINLHLAGLRVSYALNKNMRGAGKETKRWKREWAAQRQTMKSGFVLVLNSAPTSLCNLCCCGCSAGENYPMQFIPSAMAAAAASGLSPLQLQVHCFDLIFCTWLTKRLTKHFFPPRRIEWGVFQKLTV